MIIQKKVIPRRRYFRSIQTFTLLTALVLVVAGVYGYLKYQEFSVAKAALAEGQTKLITLRSLEKQTADEYISLKKTYDNDFKEIQGTLDGVYPSKENYTALTKILDDFILSTNRKNPTIFMNNLKFSKPRYDEKKQYAVLPFNLTLLTTRENFDNFLKYAENSGSLDEGSRILDVRSISISFPAKSSSSKSGSELLNVSLSLNAYFQLPTDK